MKKLILVFISLAFYSQVFSQTVVVTDNGSYTTGNASSVLDVNSVLKGFLAPRMTQAQRTAISSPADGLLVYQTDATKGFYYYNGTSAVWILLSTSSGTFWSLTGNSGTNSGANYIGTTDNAGLKIRTNATQRVLVDSLGHVAIGTTPVFNSTTPEKLLVEAGDNGSNPISSINATGTTNNYLQLNIQNKSSAHNASSDLVITSDGTKGGTVPVNTDNFYVDLGINSTGYLPANSNILNHPNTPYLYTSTNSDFFIGNGYTSKDLVFFTNYGGLNGNNSADGTEVMRITGGIGTSTQQVAIGTASPNGTNKLTVSGSISASAFNVSSDRRLKTNINGLHYGLKNIMALRPVSYNWKDPKQTSQLQIGLIAQDTKKIIPEVVSGDEKKGMLSINYTELVPVLIKAIQEQQKEIDELKKMLESSTKKNN